MKSSVARRYAKAIVELAREENSLDMYGKELRTVLAVFKGAPEIYRVLLNPMYKIGERMALIEKVASSIGASAHITRLLGILVERRKINRLEDVVEAYSRYEDEFIGRVRAQVESTEPLPEPLMEEIRQKVASATGKSVILTQKSNASLIGGLVIRIDNTILDGSIRTQLDRMKEKILEGVV